MTDASASVRREVMLLLLDVPRCRCAVRSADEKLRPPTHVVELWDEAPGFLASREPRSSVARHSRGDLDAHIREPSGGCRPMTDAERSLLGRLAAESSWANTEDRSARTAPARAAFEAKFLDQADGDPVRAAHLRRAFYARLALKSAKARRSRL